jgi:Protein of unknown function (DUF964).
MDRIKNSVNELIKTLKAHEDYVEYCQCREELEHLPDLKKRVNAFRVRSFKLHNGIVFDDIFKENDIIMEEYLELIKYPLVKKLLESELSLCRMVQSVHREIAASVDLDISDFQEHMYQEEE